MLTKSNEEKSKYINMDLCFGNKTTTAIKHYPNKYTCISISVPYFGLYEGERERGLMKQWFWIKTQLRILRFTAAIYDNSLWLRASDLLFFEIIWTDSL